MEICEEPNDPEKLEVFNDLTTIIKTTHQINASQALDEIFIGFENLRVENQENIYTVEKYGTINLIRITNIGKMFLAEEESKEELSDL